MHPLTSSRLTTSESHWFWQLVGSPKLAASTPGEGSCGGAAGCTVSKAHLDSPPRSAMQETMPSCTGHLNNPEICWPKFLGPDVVNTRHELCQGAWHGWRGPSIPPGVHRAAGLRLPGESAAGSAARPQVPDCREAPNVDLGKLPLTAAVAAVQVPPAVAQRCEVQCSLIRLAGTKRPDRHTVRWPPCR